MDESILESGTSYYPSKNKWVAFAVLAVVLLVIVIFSLRKDKFGQQTTATSTPAALCENIAAAVKITEVSTSSTDQFTIGKGTVLEPQAQAGQMIEISIPKKFAVGNTIKQCVNIIIEQ